MNKFLAKNKTLIILSGLLFFFLLSSLFLYMIPSNERGIIAYITVISAFLSLFGLLFAIIQILILKYSTEQTEKTIQNSLDRFNAINTLIDLSKNIKTIDEIQDLIRRKEYNTGLIRLGDLKKELLHSFSIPILIQYGGKENLNDIIRKLGIHIVTIANYVYHNKGKIDFSVIDGDLEKSKEHITNLEIELKNVSHGYRKNIIAN